MISLGNFYVKRHTRITKPRNELWIWLYDKEL